MKPTTLEQHMHEYCRKCGGARSAHEHRIGGLSSVLPVSCKSRPACLEELKHAFDEENAR